MILCGPSLPGYCTPGMIEYEDDQLDEFGAPLDPVACGGITGSNGKVAVWNNGCRPIPPGVSVSCYWCTTTETYIIISGPDPIYALTIIGNHGTGNGQVAIQSVLGCPSADMSNQVGMSANYLGQSLCAGQNAYGYVIEASPVVLEQVCGDTECVTQAIFYFAILQAEFVRLETYIHVSLIECPNSSMETANCFGDMECVDDCPGNPYDDPYCGCDCDCDVTITCGIEDNWMEYQLAYTKRIIYVQYVACVQPDPVVPECPSEN